MTILGQGQLLYEEVFAGGVSGFMLIRSPVPAGGVGDHLIAIRVPDEAVYFIGVVAARPMKGVSIAEVDDAGGD